MRSMTSSQPWRVMTVSPERGRPGRYAATDPNRTPSERQVIRSRSRRDAAGGKIVEDQRKRPRIEAEGSVPNHFVRPVRRLSFERPLGEEHGPPQPDHLPALVPRTAVGGRLDDQRGIRQERHGLVAQGKVRPVDGLTARELRHQQMPLADRVLEVPVFAAPRTGRAMCPGRLLSCLRCSSPSHGPRCRFPTPARSPP